MRFLLKAKIPVEAGNALVRDANFGKRMQDILGDIKPETAYFAVEGGQRTIYLLVQVSDGSALPALLEPLWLALKADVEVIPTMTAEDFAKAAPHIERAAKKF